jgi:hypothetical protein
MVFPATTIPYADGPPARIVVEGMILRRASAMEDRAVRARKTGGHPTLTPWNCRPVFHRVNIECERPRNTNYTKEDSEGERQGALSDLNNSAVARAGSAVARAGSVDTRAGSADTRAGSVNTRAGDAKAHSGRRRLNLVAALHHLSGVNHYSRSA